MSSSRLQQRILCCSLLAFFFAHSTVAAQSPQQRIELRQFQDSLKTVTDTAQLRGYEQQVIERAKLARMDAMLHLRLGLIAFRLSELGSKKHIDYSISEFEWALELQPRWPWPVHGLGLIYRVAPDRARGFAGGLFSVLAIDELSKATAGFSSALEADSSFTDALLNLTQVALEKRLNSPAASTLPALRTAAARTPTPELYWALGELERRAGSADSALLAYAHLRDSLGYTPQVLLELARTAPLVKDSLVDALALPSADSAYFLGIALADSEVVALYRQDLEPIVDDSVLARFDSLSGAARSDFLREFWSERDALDLREPGARLGEHFRRWAYVLKHYRLSPFRRRYAIVVEPYREGGRDIDDRGRVYLRHGLPVNRNAWPQFEAITPISHVGMVSAAALSFMDNNGRITSQKPFAFYRPPLNSGLYGSETWLYQLPDGDLVLHFAAHFDPDDYRLQSTPFSMGRNFPDYWVHGSKISGTLVRGPFGDPSRVAELVIKGKRDNRLATTTDSWTRTYENILPSRAAWFAAGIEGGRPLMHLVYAYNASAVVGEPWRLIPFQIRAAFLDSTGRVRATLDTVELVQRPTDPKALMAFRAQVPVPEGATRVRLSVQVTPELGALHRTDTLRIPVVDGRRLDLSDILIGRSPGSLHWDPVGDVRAWLDPLLLNYLPVDTLQVYTEAYGMRAGQDYTVSLTISRVQGAVSKLLGRSGSTITLVEKLSAASELVTRINRSVSLSSLDSGDYWLTVTIRGAGEEVASQRRITIAKPKKPGSK